MKTSLGGTVALCLNGTISSKIKQLKGPLIICADRAASTVSKLGLTPHIIVGDLDSLQSTDFKNSSLEAAEVIELPKEKSETDGERALEVALEKNPSQLEIFGIDGGRVDMMYFNIALLLHPTLASLPTRCHFSDHSEGVLVTKDLRAQLSPPVDSTLSLLPLTDEVFVESLSGVKWELNSETILRSKARTVSNVVTSSVDCRVRAGRALLIVKAAQ